MDALSAVLSTLQWFAGTDVREEKYHPETAGRKNITCCFTQVLEQMHTDNCKKNIYNDFAQIAAVSHCKLTHISVFASIYYNVSRVFCGRTKGA